MSQISIPQIIKSKWFESVIYYAFIFLFFTVSLIPFNIVLNFKVKSVPFHYIYIGGFTGILVVLSFLRNPQLNLFERWLIFLVAGFSLSLITSIDRVHTIRVLGGFFSKGIFISFIAERILREKIKATITILMFCASLIAFWGFQTDLSYWSIYTTFLHKILLFIPIDNPLALAAFLILFFPLALLYGKGKKNFIKIIPGFLILVSIIFSFSRSGWFSLFFVITIYFLKEGSFKKIIENQIYILILVMLIILLFTLIPHLSIPLKNKFNIKMFSSNSFEHRLKSYIATKNILKDYPLFGVGFGNYPKVREKYMVEGMHRDTPTPDNMYLRFLCDTGIIGTGTFFVFIIYWMYQLWKKRDNPLVWVIFCGLIGFLINQLAADLMLWPATQFGFWMLLGFGVGLLKNEHS